MHLSLEQVDRLSPPFWRNPFSWLRRKNLSRDFWVFFTAAFFFDAGFAVYFFLFNLYLLDFHFNERTIGLVSGALTLGSLVGTLPAGIFARVFGVRSLLIVCFVAAPTMGALRAIWMAEPAQIGLAFGAGVAMSSWGVCFLPAVARLTTEANRASAFSLIFSVSIGTSALGGLVCGYMPRWLSAAGFGMPPAQVKELILLSSCAIALIGLIAVLLLRLPIEMEERATSSSSTWGFARWTISPFLWRFLPAMTLWAAVLAAFAPFANVYLSRDRHIPLAQIGLIFSTSQVVQLCAGLLTPSLFRAFGLINGVAVTQVVTAFALVSLAGSRQAAGVITFYLLFSSAQWMSSPGLYNLVMSETPDRDRSTVASITLFCNASAGAVATTISGGLLSRFGYPPVMLGVAGLALVAAAFLRLSIAPLRTQREGNDQYEVC
jgi:MFS family permease